MSLPKGFRYAGVRCGIKKSGLPDLTLIVADRPCVAAGVYTQNVVRAACIDWNRTITPTDRCRGVAINSGNANACTGEQGTADNRQLAETVARKLDAQPDQICILSTGVIGHLLPMTKLVNGVESCFLELGNSPGHFDSASRAILTTDKSPKTIQSTIMIGDLEIQVAAIAKGAGMIGPNMATMLAVVTTDANLDVRSAQEILQRVANRTFNRISVEGHTSTNDALLMLASGQADDQQAPLAGSDRDTFEVELTAICTKLAKLIPADGEGATRLIAISVMGAKSDQDAERVSRSIAQSNLVKTAMTGADPNWGRIVSAAGYCGVQMQPEEISLWLNGFELFRQGTPLSFDAAAVSQSIKQEPETRIELTIGTGDGTAQHWTSDLTVEYVKFNSEYHT